MGGGAHRQCGMGWRGAGGTLDGIRRSVPGTSTPKTIYSQSEARRLRPQPCPDCGKMSRVDRNLQDDAAGKPDPDVSVVWYCPDPLCVGHDGFSTETL